MIYLKTASDFEKRRVAGAIVRDTLLLMEEKAKEGVTTTELNKRRRLHQKMRRQNRVF